MPTFRREAGINHIRKEPLEVLSLILFHLFDPSPRVFRREPLGSLVCLDRVRPADIAASPPRSHK